MNTIQTHPQAQRTRVRTTPSRSALVASILFASGWVCGCSQSVSTVPIPSDQSRVDRRGSSASDQNTNTIVAILDGSPIRVSDLWPASAETAGATALEELVLDRGLARLAEVRNVSIAPAQAELERSAIVAAISAEVGADESLADQAMARVRTARGLGPARFAALLNRTALMRALVRGDVSVTDAEVAAEVELAIGRQVRAIVAMFSTEKEAAEVRAGLVAESGERLVRLSAIARARSIDESARNGGLVGPLHPQDPRVPGTLRPVLESLAIGEVSPVLAADGGFAVIMIESRTEPIEPTDEARAKARSSVQQRKERIAMDALARRILSESSVEIMDESLRWTWQRTRQSN